MSKNNNVANAFACTTAIINLIIVAQFFKAICIDIFKYLFAIGFKDGGLLGPMLINFEMIKINGQDMLQFHCLIWLCEAFYLLKICNLLCLDFIYAAKMIKFIKNIIKCFINFRLLLETLFQKVL